MFGAGILSTHVHHSTLLIAHEDVVNVRVLSVRWQEVRPRVILPHHFQDRWVAVTPTTVTGTSRLQ